MNDTTLALVVSELAQEIESENPIDWGDLQISEEGAYDLIANQIVEMFKNTTEERIQMLAVITNLVVENFVLNLKLLKMCKLE